MHQSGSQSFPLIDLLLKSASHGRRNPSFRDTIEEIVGHRIRDGDPDHSSLDHAIIVTMPWLKGKRPDWLIRAGLAMYDSLAKSRLMPGTRTISLRGTPEGAPLEDRFVKAFEYSDAWVEDSRLVECRVEGWDKQTKWHGGTSC